jgi:YegS/Rv2252/BmrU family lipid kinase
MSLMLIVNPSAGGGRAGRAMPGVEAALRDRRLDYQVERTRSLEHARELAQAAAAAGRTAVALGGDGLIGAVAGALSGNDGVLGVLPGGRGNDFARTLGIPLDPRAACEVLASGVVRALDLGEAGGKPFIGIASCGFDSDANRIANEARVVRGNLVYAYGALRALASWRPATFSVRFDGGEPHVARGYTVAAANSKAYGGGMWMAPAAALDDGLLDVVIVRAKEIEISAERPFTLYADGDPIASLPVKVRALPGAVKVIVPR